MAKLIKVKRQGKCEPCGKAYLFNYPGKVMGTECPFCGDTLSRTSRQLKTNWIFVNDMECDPISMFLNGNMQAPVERKDYTLY